MGALGVGPPILVILGHLELKMAAKMAILAISFWHEMVKMAKMAKNGQKCSIRPKKIPQNLKNGSNWPKGLK